MKNLTLTEKALFLALKNDQIDPEKTNFLKGGDAPGGGDGDGARPGDGPWNP